MRKRKINVLLDDGSAAGIKFVTLSSRTTQVVVCPKDLVSQAIAKSEIQRPGVYILFKNKEKTKPRIYIGTAEEVHKRLRNHLSSRDFDEVFIFTRKDNSLTSTHAKYLESRMFRLAQESARAVLDNTNDSNEPSLPPGENDEMDEYLDEVLDILTVLRFPYLQLVDEEGDAPPTDEPPPPKPPKPGKPDLADIELYLHESKNGVHARGFNQGQKFLVLSGSEGSGKLGKSLSKNLRKRRQELIAEGKIKQTNDSILFSQDVPFGSSSEAATLICGSPRSGPAAWKDANGRTLKDLQKVLPDVPKTSPSDTAKQKAVNPSGFSKRPQVKRKSKATKKLGIEDIFQAGLIKAGEEVWFKGDPDSKAELVDGRNCRFEGREMSVSAFAKEISGWEGVNIYRYVIHGPTKNPLQKLRDQLKKNG